MAICDTTNTIKKYDRYFISGQNWIISRVTLLILNSKITNIFLVERGAKRGQILEIPEHN